MAAFRKFLSRLLASFTALLLVWSATPAIVAYAQTDDIGGDPTDLQVQVEETGRAYDQATQHVKELQKQIADNNQRIEELDAHIKKQQEACEISLKELYKFHHDDMTLINMMFSSGSIGSFFSTMDYLNRVQETYSSDLQKLNAMHEERVAVQKTLDEARAEAEEEQRRADQAFSAARQRRDAAQKAARALLEEDVQALQSLDYEGSVVSADGADWSMDRATFINAWKGRLDSYLAGSPLAGYGASFAAAAWENGIDPRFSAAISCMESSKGRYCFLPHNAWGWGQVSWSSWDEAIAAHARGLARGYGYTLSLAGAQKYCPPNWRHWYATVGSEMSRI